MRRKREPEFPGMYDELELRITRDWLSLSRDIPDRVIPTLECLYDHANPDLDDWWWAYPSINRVAQITGTTRQSVAEHVATLKAHDILQEYRCIRKGASLATATPFRVFRLVPPSTYGYRKPANCRDVEVVHVDGRPGLWWFSEATTNETERCLDKLQEIRLRAAWWTCLRTIPIRHSWLRVLRALLLHAYYHEGATANEGRKWSVSLTRPHLAELVGCSESKTYKALRALRKVGIIAEAPTVVATLTHKGISTVRMWLCDPDTLGVVPRYMGNKQKRKAPEGHRNAVPRFPPPHQQRAQ